MSTLPLAGSPHSADVSAVLLVDGRRIPLAKIAPGRVYLQRPETLPEGAAQIELKVDNTCRSWNVRLPHGAVPFDRSAETERV